MRVPCTAHIAVSNAFRLLGSGEPIVGEAGTLKVPASSQMPFGFWVLGNHISGHASMLMEVSNAFRLLGSGEPATKKKSK